MVSIQFIELAFAAPRGLYLHNPIFERSMPEHEYLAGTEKWNQLRTFFKAAKAGEFAKLDGLLEFFVSQTDFALRANARTLLGDAGTDRQLEAAEVYVRNESFEPSNSCELCEALAIWGRLSATQTIYVAFDRFGLGQLTDGLVAALTTVLEPSWGPLADHPEDESVEAFAKYEAHFQATYAEVLAKVGCERAYVFFGERFGARELASRYLEHLGPDPWSKMMRPFLRRRFEASTGIDCSEFYRDEDFQPLVAAARLEAWLDSPAAARFEPGVRYFFGHRIPEST